MEVFGIIGMSLGAVGFVFGISALTQVNSLKKELENLKRKLEDRRQ